MDTKITEMTQELEDRMNALKGLVLGVVLIVGMGLSVMAQTEGEKPAAMPQMGPPQELQQLAKMVGSWNYAGEMRMSPDAPWTPHTAYNVNSFVCGGAAFQTDFTGPMMGMEMKGLGLITFDRETGKWQSIWTDNLAGRISYYEGDFKDGKLVVSGQDEMQGQTSYTRTTYLDITDTTHKFTMESSMDGQSWFVSMQGTYTKKQ